MELLPPENFSTLFLDMNSYFASVEQQVNVPFRGKPVGIAPYTGGSGCIIACSREAKLQGVRTGDRVLDAIKKCPKIIILESRPELYLFYHKEILATLLNISPWVTPLSVDEFKIILRGRDKTFLGATKVAENIKKMISQKADYLKCSVGIGPNVFLAKVSAESKKPDGLTMCLLENLDKFYQNIKLRDLPGINFQMEKRLAECGVYTASEFYNANFVFLRNILGHLGKVWYYRLRGFEVDNLLTKNRSVGHSHVLAPNVRNRESAMAVLKKLGVKTAYRLRKDNLWAGGVAVYINFINGGKFYNFKNSDLFNDTATMLEMIGKICKSCPDQKPIYVAVRTIKIVRGGFRQISFIDGIEKNKRISEAVDLINDKFGGQTIYPSSISKGAGEAPDRIPFGKPRYEIRF